MPTTFSYHFPVFLCCFAISLLSGCYDHDKDKRAEEGSSTVGVIAHDDGKSDSSEDIPSNTPDEDEYAEENIDDFDSSTGSAPISVHELTLSWRPNTGLIDGYMIFHGPAPESATALLSITLETTIHLDPVLDLGLKTGDPACFRIKAYNASGISDFSDAVCFTYNT